MSSFFVAPEAAPPNDKQWLISSAKELRTDVQVLAKRKNECKGTFPGVRSGYIAKLDWVDKMEEVYHQKMFNELDVSLPMNPVQELRAVLKEAAPDEVEVELVVFEKFLEKFGVSKIGDTNVYVDAQGEAPIVPGSNNTGSLSDTAEKSRQNSKLCVIARKVVPKTTNANDLMNEITDSIGITKQTRILQPTPKGAKGHTLTFAPGIETVAECVYYASGDDEHVKVPLQLIGYGPEKAAYRARIEEKEKMHRDIGLTHFIVRKSSQNSDDDDEEAESDEDGVDNEPEPDEVIWFRENEEFMRVVRHLHDGEGESSAVKNRLENGTTDSGNLTVNLIEAEFEYLKKVKKFAPWPVKLACLMGITLKLLNDNYWAVDNEMPKQTKKLLNGIASYWKTKALVQSDLILGLGIPGDANSGKTSREALLNFLAKVQKEYESMDKDTFGYKFACLPSTSRKKRRTSGGSSVST